MPAGAWNNMLMRWHLLAQGRSRRPDKLWNRYRQDADAV